VGPSEGGVAPGLSASLQKRASDLSEKKHSCAAARAVERHATAASMAQMVRAMNQKSKASERADGSQLPIVVGQMAKEKQRVVEALSKLNERYPEVTRVVKTRHASTIVLHHQREVIRHMKNGGELSDLDAKALTDLVNERLRKIYLTRDGVRAYLGRTQNNVAKIVMDKLEMAVHAEEDAVSAVACKWKQGHAAGKGKARVGAEPAMSTHDRVSPSDS